VAASVAGDNDLEGLGKDATTPLAIAGEGSQDFSGLQVPLSSEIVRHQERCPDAGCCRVLDVHVWFAPVAQGRTSTERAGCRQEQTVAIVQCV
jgi:hypothetical protein